MAPILCVVAVKMEAEVTLKITRHFVRGIAPMLFVVAVFTGADSFTNFARVIGDYSSVVTQLCD
jgi:hypothetical protein